MPLQIETKTRNPDRKGSSANVSIPWALYDKLDKLAMKQNASMGKVIEALYTFHKEEGK